MYSSLGLITPYSNVLKANAHNATIIIILKNNIINGRNFNSAFNANGIPFEILYFLHISLASSLVHFEKYE